jgi:hypothetical protein
VTAARAALKDAAEKLGTIATGAGSFAADKGSELKDIAAAGFKSLKAGWEEARKTFGEERSEK